MKKIFGLVLLMVPLAGFGQTAGMLSMAHEELAKRGLEEAEVRTRLLENGIDVDNTTNGVKQATLIQRRKKHRKEYRRKIEKNIETIYQWKHIRPLCNGEVNFLYRL